MVPSRNGPKEAEIASFGLAILVFVLTPTQIGYQDLAAPVAQQPAVAARWREHLIASPFGTIHAAAFSLPRPVGTSIPEPPMLRLAGKLGKHDGLRIGQLIVAMVVEFNFAGLRAGRHDRLLGPLFR